MKAHPGATEAYLEPVEVCLGAVELHPGALEAHHGALEAYPGPVEAPPGAMVKFLFEGIRNFANFNPLSYKILIFAKFQKSVL